MGDKKPSHVEDSRRVTWTEYLAMEALVDDRERLEFSHRAVLAPGEPSQDHETIISDITPLLGPRSPVRLPVLDSMLPTL